MTKHALYLALAALAACATTKPPTSAAPQPAAKPAAALFSHQSHYNGPLKSKPLGCVDCHKYTAAVEDFTRPYHAPCSEAGCHDTYNYKATGPVKDVLCENCHAEGVGPTGLPLLRAFPDARKGFVALREFAHKTHLEASGPSFAAFGKTNCDTCHAIEADGDAKMPGHKECALCHGVKAPSPAAPRLGPKATQEDCLGCHADARRDETVRGRRF
jgi:hypothetical protein